MSDLELSSFEMHYFSRIRLRRNVSAAALARSLLPNELNARLNAAHRLIWSVFPHKPDQKRDFLWREEGSKGLSPGSGSFLVLSRRPPEDEHGLFEIDPPKPFEPNLQPEDRLGFLLRVNPVVARSVEVRDGEKGRSRSKRCDVVMDRLKALPSEARAEKRTKVMNEAALDWLASQGRARGFRFERNEVSVDGYCRLRIPREGCSRKSSSFSPVMVSTLDLEGYLTVEHPKHFMRSICAGFGRAKAFGCGLMLIRRV
ncbi:CRISPR system Cascade subunit CasE [Azospirillaceae bacterium]